MSDTEGADSKTITRPSNNTPSELIEGAYGGDEGLRPSTPFSENGDNLSMEVRFSEGSSHHASDISSVSYQNLLDDDTPGGNRSRRDSEDSVDSYLPDYCDDAPSSMIKDRDGIQGSQSFGYSDKISERISIQMTGDRLHVTTTSEDFSSKSGVNCVQSEAGPYNSDSGRSFPLDSLNSQPITAHDCFRKHELVVNMRDQQRSKSLPPNEQGSEEVAKKRNSLEIRNNIPVTGEVKNYEKDIHIDNVQFTSQGAKPKIKKQSPGLACRVEEKEGESPEKVQNTVTAMSEPVADKLMDTNATQIINDLIQVSKANAAALTAASRKEGSSESKSDPNLGFTNGGMINPLANLGNLSSHKPADIVNEYEYVKYSRIQEGNSYVGMRLAYNSSESDGLQQSVNGLEGFLDNSHEVTPERYSSPDSHCNVPTSVSEDMLTEIPLNGPDITSVIASEANEDRKLFTLSPENTECDSVEIESVVSDGENESSGMPNVEDGLSSSQTSDVEENGRSEHNTPKKLLQKKHQQEVERKLYGVECSSMKPREMDAEAIMDDLKLKREALDHAISEIKSAIQKSKGVALEAPYNPVSEEDPVWVKRDEPVQPVIPIGGSTHEVIHAREEAEKRRQNQELHKKEEEHGHHDASNEKTEKDQLLEKEFSKTDGKVYSQPPKDYDTDEETDQLLEKQYQGNQYVEIPELSQPPVNRSAQAEKRRSRAKEVLIEGVLFRARYLGSTQLISEGQPSKAMRMMQAQEAVGRIKAPEGENQPSTEVDLFVSTEKIMVLNTDLQEIMMDHSLRTISYIADIGEILVIMARRRLMGSPGDTDSMRRRKQAKIICHVFETEEAQLIAQSIGQAFQVAYMEFLKANGIEDPGLMKEIDYQEVLNQQQIYGEELSMFSNKEMQKEVIVPKLKSEALGVVIVESGWGSMVPTVVLANMNPAGPAARCGQLNIGDQIISVNGISLVGLPLSSCQTYIKGTKHQTVVKLTVVPCPPVVEVCIKRPDVKYQLGFSVQNGVICSLLRGGIAERGGVRVGHRIIEINNQSVVAVPHEKIVSLLANSVGEIHMKTMPTSIFRLLTGQETPHYL